MTKRQIDNPILNSPFEVPTRHFEFDQEGITGTIVEARRLSGYFVPVPPPKKKGKQLSLEIGWTERWESSPFINRVRERVAVWRAQKWAGTTGTTKRLLEHWSDASRERRLFFCQLEAVETAIYLGEVADKGGDAWIANSLREANQSMNPGLARVALKMATGSGKTLVMGMLIAWQALNKLANSQDSRFSDSFLIVTPGITIRDRLRVLLPADPDSYYRQHDLVPPDMLERLGSARIVIVNYHAFLPRTTVEASKTTKAILGRGQGDLFVESGDAMVRRVCRELGAKRNLVVINDEAHHCYRPKPADADEETVTLTGEERREARKRDEEARVWLSGLEAVARKVGVRAVYDLSATPFFLAGSGYGEGRLFPWVVSDFSLIDAIEAGIVKIPRVPVADDAMTGELPTYRDLWNRIRDAGLPKKSRGAARVTGTPVLPQELEGAIQSLYGHYKKAFDAWHGNADARARGATPPVYIVVCNNTNVSKLVFDHLAGYPKLDGDGNPLVEPDGQPVLVPSEYPIFSNVTEHGRWVARPNTILVDSEQLESGEAMSADFKRVAATEIDEWKAEVRARFPGRDTEDLTDEDLLREVMNTVGKAGKLGENVRCVVSVSMLTEGWDANTVTHILGVRAFGTQLLCEQVVGRGLRRRSYVLGENGRFPPEYAEVYGVPFSFIPTSAAGDGGETTLSTRVRFLEERAALDIQFPRIEGYRFEVGSAPLAFAWSPESRLSVSTADVPTTVENAPMIGEVAIHDLKDLEARREQEVDFRLARHLHQRAFSHQPWRFPELLRIVRAWRETCLDLKDRVFPQYLLFASIGQKAVDRIARGLREEGVANERLLPIPAAYDSTGNCRHVDFATVKYAWPTRADKSPLSHAVCDTRDWEEKVAESLEGMTEILSYVKNERLGFEIPYELGGQRKAYRPDFLVRYDDGRGAADPLHLVLEVSGQRLDEKEAKVATARDQWVPAVNNAGTWGRWAFYEIRDPWGCQKELRNYVLSLRGESAA
jgi:type III restriction enzyme